MSCFTRNPFNQSDWTGTTSPCWSLSCHLWFNQNSNTVEYQSIWTTNWTLKREITIRKKGHVADFLLCLSFFFSYADFSPNSLFFILSIYFSHCVSVLIKRRLDVASVGSGNVSVAVPNFHSRAFKQDWFSSNLFSQIKPHLFFLHVNNT